VARSATRPPVTGAGEPDRDAKGLNDVVEGRSLLSSIKGELDDELEELEELEKVEMLSCVPSVAAVERVGCGFAAAVPGSGEAGAFPEPGVK